MSGLIQRTASQRLGVSMRNFLARPVQQIRSGSTSTTAQSHAAHNAAHSPKAQVKVDPKVYNPSENVPFEREIEYVGDPSRVAESYADVLKTLRSKTVPKTN